MFMIGEVPRIESLPCIVITLRGTQLACRRFGMLVFSIEKLTDQ